MSLNTGKFFASFLLAALFSIAALAQTSADVMRGRVSKAKAFIAVKNYNAAIYELENIRRETNDATVNSVINVLLMNSFLEQGDYKRAQDFLKELSAPQKSNRQINAANYLAAAGQVIRVSRSQLERYRSLGLSISDRNLPTEASTDIEKMRQTLEMIVEQSKILGREKAHTSNAMALLEEATGARSSLAKDDFDATRWKNEAADAREMLANSRSVITNVVDGSVTTAANTNNAAVNNTPIYTPETTKSSAANTAFQPVSDAPTYTSKIAAPKTDNSQTTAKIEKPVSTEKTREEITKPQERLRAETLIQNTAGNSVPTIRSRRVEMSSGVNSSNQTANINQTQSIAANSFAPRSDTPVQIGSLIEYVTQRVTPVYPAAAKTIRMAGVVKVEVMVDEEGKVSEIQKTTGPSMLQRAATDAVKRWKFRPFVRDGQPTKATGFVSFNFSL